MTYPIFYLTYILLTIHNITNLCAIKFTYYTSYIHIQVKYTSQTAKILALIHS